MPLEGLRWSRDSGSALYDTPQNGRSRTGWGVGGGGIFIYVFIYYNLQRWSKGVGVLGCPLCPACPCHAGIILAHAITLGLLPLQPLLGSRG